MCLPCIYLKRVYDVKVRGVRLDTGEEGSTVTMVLYSEGVLHLPDHSLHHSHLCLCVLHCDEVETGHHVGRNCGRALLRLRLLVMN